MRISRINPFTAAVISSTLLVLASATPALANDVDHKIETAARNSYNFKVFLKDDGIKVTCVKGMVVLSGSATGEMHRSLAEATVAGLPGVHGVDNRILLIGEQPATASDEWITMKVKSSLAFHKNVSANATEVHTSAGVVTLTGVAGSAAERDLAGEYAKDVDGVMDVHNNIAVAVPPARTHPTVGERVGETIDDSSITAQIKTTLLFHKSVRALATKVITHNGVVSVHGEAKTEAEKEKVTRLAEDIAGVVRVVNHMSIANS